MLTPSAPRASWPAGDLGSGSPFPAQQPPHKHYQHHVTRQRLSKSRSQRIMKSCATDTEGGTPHRNASCRGLVSCSAVAAWACKSSISATAWPEEPGPQGNGKSFTHRERVHTRSEDLSGQPEHAHLLPGFVSGPDFLRGRCPQRDKNALFQ